MHVLLSLPTLGCALVQFPSPGMWAFRLVEPCCVFASLVLVASARAMGFDLLLVWLGCFVFLLFIRWFCVGLMPFPIFLGEVLPVFLFFWGPLASCFVLVCLVAFFW